MTSRVALDPFGEVFDILMAVEHLDTMRRRQGPTVERLWLSEVMYRSLKSQVRSSETAMAGQLEHAMPCGGIEVHVSTFLRGGEHLIEWSDGSMQPVGFRADPL